MARLALTGDVMLGRRVGKTLAQRPPEDPWGDILEDLRAAEALMVNLECQIATSGRPEPGRVFHFRAPPEAIDVLQAAHIDLVTLANNHALDFGGVALEETLERLDDAGIEHVGAGSTVEDAWEPCRLSVDDLTVGVVAFTDNVPAWDIEKRQPGLAFCPVDPQGATYERLVEEVRGLARACDVTIVTAHWGPNMRRRPPTSFQAVARGLVDAGADLFWGHSAHLFQGIELRERGVILYDAGDFLDDYRRDPDEHNERSFLFEVELSEHAVGPVHLLPVEIDPRACRVGRADEESATWTVDRMQELCEPFGTRLVPGDREGWWQATRAPRGDGDG